jgi:hypothetical protein
LTFILERRSASAVLRTVCLALISVLALIAVLGLIAGPGMAAAGQGGTGVVNAIAGPSVPAGAPVSVVAGEFTDVNTRLQEVVERALADRGFTVARDAPLILSFDVEMSNRTSDIEHRGGGNIVGSGEPGMDAPSRRLPWQDAGGELGREEPDIGESRFKIPFGGGGNGGGSRHALSFTLGHDARPPIWQGSVTVTLATTDPFAAAQAMVPVLVNYIGQTVHEEQVTID